LFAIAAAMSSLAIAVVGPPAAISQHSES